MRSARVGMHGRLMIADRFFNGVKAGQPARRRLMSWVLSSFQQLMQIDALRSVSDVAWSGTNSRLPQRGWANWPQLLQAKGEENRVNVLSQRPQRFPMCLMVISVESVGN